MLVIKVMFMANYEFRIRRVKYIRILKGTLF